MEDEEKKAHGRKCVAGKLLTSYLTDIAREVTEEIDAPNGVRMATKAEAAARKMWDMALGEKDLDGVRGKPDKAMLSLIFERLEGKAPQTVAGDPSKMSVAGRVKAEGKKRINKAGGLDAGDRGTEADS